MAWTAGHFSHFGGLQSKIINHEDTKVHEEKLSFFDQR